MSRNYCNIGASNVPKTENFETEICNSIGRLQTNCKMKNKHPLLSLNQIRVSKISSDATSRHVTEFIVRILLLRSIIQRLVYKKRTEGVSLAFRSRVQQRIR